MANEPAPAAAKTTPATAGPTPAQRAASAEFERGPTERFERDQATQRAADPWSDPNVTITRGEDGKPKVTAKAAPAAKVDLAAILDPEARAAAAEGQERVKVGDVELTPEEIAAAVEHKAAEDSRKLTLPTKPAEYRLELPADLVLPEGIKFEFKPDDPFLGPVIAKAREHALEQGWDQAQFSKMLGLYASSQVHQQTMLRDARLAEAKKLGDAGPARIDALCTWIDATQPPDAAASMKLMLVNEPIVRGFERIMQRQSDQSGENYSHLGRDSETAERVSDATWNSWSYVQQKEYADQFPQAGRPAANGRGR
jgi:hypothetical protein